jgi:hypothetical protein
MFNRLKDRVISASAHYYVCSAISFTAVNKLNISVVYQIENESRVLRCTRVTCLFC